MIDAYGHMRTSQILNFTDYDDGKMLGDAYYVTGENDTYIESVNYYKDEYIYVYIHFLNDDQTEGIIIDEIKIEYCDYEKDIYLSASAFDAQQPYVNREITYQALFDIIEQLSIQQMRYVLTSLDLL